MVTRVPLTRHEDDRGWFQELMRASALPKPVRQANLARSRRGVIRALHYHERGQDDLFVCLEGMVRVVVLNRETGETFTEDIGDDNPVAIYVEGWNAHGYEALTDCLFCYFVTEEYDPDEPRRARGPLERSARRPPLEHPIADLVGAGPARRVVITGAGGQLGHALAEAFPDARTLTRADWDIGLPPPPGLSAELVLHAAAWTDVDGAEDDPQEAAAVNIGGVQHAAELGAPLVVWSSDYVFDGTKREPYVESDAPAPLGVYGRTKLHGEAAAGEQAWIVRSSWLFGWTSTNFVRTMLRLGAVHDEVAVVADQRGAPTFVGHLAAATEQVLQLPYGVYHVAAAGDCTWADFAEAIFEEAGLATRVRRITSDEFGARAPRPAYSVLRSERGAPELPHWREGLRECLARL